MTLFGVTLVLLFGGLRLGQRAWDQGSGRAERIHALAQVDRFLRRALAQLQPLRIPKDKGQALTFSGDKQALLFTAPLPAQAAPPGLYWIGIAARGGRLILRFQPFDPEREPMEGEVKEHVLLEGVKGAAFRYFGQEGGQGEAEWHERWEAQMALPSKVALTLETDTPWPELVIPLRHNTYTPFLPRL